MLEAIYMKLCILGDFKTAERMEQVYLHIFHPGLFERLKKDGNDS